MKSLNIIKWVLLALSAVVFVIAFTTIKDIDSATLDLYMGWTYALIAVALVATLGFPLVKAFKNKKSLIKLIILIIAIVVIFGGAYLIAPGTPLNITTQSTPGELKFADAALYITYLFIAAAVVALVWTGIRNSIKK